MYLFHATSSRSLYDFGMCCFMARGESTRKKAIWWDHAHWLLVWYYSASRDITVPITDWFPHSGGTWDHIYPPLASTISLKLSFCLQNYDLMTKYGVCVLFSFIFSFFSLSLSFLPLPLSLPNFLLLLSLWLLISSCLSPFVWTSLVFLLSITESPRMHVCL